MALSNKFRARTEQVQNERERLAIERATNSAKKLFESDQFKLSALALPESDMAVDAIIKTTVNACLNPTASFIDTLRAKGFRPAEIRATVHNLYRQFYCLSDSNKADEMTYEEMLEPVALYVTEHQELYNALDPEQLRG